MLFYEDGRFAKDKIWCFYPLNNITRINNNKNASFYVKSGIKNAPKTLDQLKTDLKNGKTDFIDKIFVLNRKNRGSNDYWRSQRYQVHSWINYHIDKGNGPPDIFLTLSCAEYYWPDIIKLLEERIWIEEGENVDEDNNLLYKSGGIIDLKSDNTCIHLLYYTLYFCYKLNHKMFMY